MSERGGGGGRVQRGRRISGAAEHGHSKREYPLICCTLLSLFIFLHSTFHLQLLHFVKKNLSSKNFKPPLSVCFTFHTLPPPPPSSPRYCLLTPSLSPSLPHVQRCDHDVSLSHLQFALNTLLPCQSPASFYFSVSAWQQHHIIRLNPRANMPPHLNRLRRMRESTATLQTQFLQSVLFQLVFFTSINTLLHAHFLRISWRLTFLLNYRNNFPRGLTYRNWYE